MKLSEFYPNEEFVYTIEGIQFSRDYKKIDSGELYIDEERNLYYKGVSSSSPVLLRTDVGEWIYFNDTKIVCSASDLDNSGDAIYICVVDIQGNLIASGSLTQFGLVYTRNDQIIREDPNQTETVIFELNSPQSPVMYWDDSFSLPFYYPHSDFLYNKFYDYDGVFQEDKTKSAFLQMFLRDLIYSFVNCPIGPLGLTGQQKKALDKLDEIRFGTTKVTYDVVDRIISIAEEGNISDKYAVKGYQMIKKLFVSHGINDCLVKPMLNIMAISRSGEFGRRSHKWISLINAKRIKAIAKRSKGNFCNIVTDISLLRKEMRNIAN